MDRSAPAASDEMAPPFELVRRGAGPALRPDVLEFVGYAEASTFVSRKAEAATLVVPLIISFGQPFRLGMGREPVSFHVHHSFVGGLTAGPVTILSGGGARCLQVNFSPLGAARFLGIPMRDVTDRVVDMDEIGDAALSELAARLEDCESWDDRFDLTEIFIRRRFAMRPIARDATREAYRLILESGGTRRIERVARHVGWSRKHLTDRFWQDVGLAPKTVARIARFQRARRIACEGRHGWADIAIAAGYADQAHLVREFGALSGMNPTATADSAR